MMDDGLSKVKAWLAAKHGAEVEIGDTEDLIDNRIIDSLWFLEFILFIEEISGHENILESATVDAFRTLRAIDETFLQGMQQSELTEGI
jgi:acyl carrier protein